MEYKRNIYIYIYTWNRCHSILRHHTLIFTASRLLMISSSQTPYPILVAKLVRTSISSSLIFEFVSLFDCLNMGYPKKFCGWKSLDHPSDRSQQKWRSPYLGHRGHFQEEAMGGQSQAGTAGMLGEALRSHWNCLQKPRKKHGTSLFSWENSFLTGPWSVAKYWIAGKDCYPSFW